MAMAMGFVVPCWTSKDYPTTLGPSALNQKNPQTPRAIQSGVAYPSCSRVENKYAFSISIHKPSGVSPDLKPRGLVFFRVMQGALGGPPAQLHFSKDALRVRHHGREAAISGRHCGEALLASIGVGWIVVGGLAQAIHKAHDTRDLGGVTLGAEVGIALTMGHSNGVAKSLKAFKENAL